MVSRRQFGLAASLLATAALTAGSLLAVASASASPGPGDEAPGFTATDTNGNTVSLSDYADQTVVLEWTNHDCPYVKKHYVATDNMPSLQTKWTEQGVVWINIISSAPDTQGYVSAEEANAIAEERGWATDAILLDPDNVIRTLYDARTTPHMYVIHEGTLRYSGAIDDRATARASDVEGATNYVDDALTAIANGEEIEVTETRAYGCSIKNDLG